MIKLIISDLDGVLIDSREIHFLALNKALAEVDNKYIISEEEHLSTYDGLPTKRKLEMLTKEKNLPTSYYDKIFQNKQKYTQELLLNSVQRNERLIEIFRKLKSQGYKIWVASNAIRDTVKTILLKQGILEHIDSFMSNEDVKHTKPFPEMYMKIMIQEGILPSETLIIEDSYIGLSAAWESGANVCPVKNPNDFTEDKLNEYLNNNYVKNNKWIDKKLNIVIPMAGMGSRFIEGGFTDPKPLIKVKDKLMIQLVCENLNIDANYIFIVRKEHYEKYNLKSILNIIAPNCQIIQVTEVTEGAACTVLLAKQYINDDNPLIIANSDQFIEWNSGEFYHSFLNTENCDGIILTFEANDKKWSYAKTDDNGFVTEVKEKEIISNHGTVGIYGYRKGSDFVKYSEQMIEKNIRVNNEFYVCPVYNEFIKDNKTIRIYDVKKMWGLGVPSDLHQYLNEYKK